MAISSVKEFRFMAPLVVKGWERVESARGEQIIRYLNIIRIISDSWHHHCTGERMGDGGLESTYG